MGEKLNPDDAAFVRNRDVDWLFAKLDILFKDVASIKKSLETIAAGAKASASPPAEIDLDAPVNDPEVKLEPTKGANKWTGESMKGKRFSACPSDYLDRLALMYEYMAANPKEGKEKFRAGNLLDAARARAWAKRNRTTGDAQPGADTW